ncbi:hypothetical protein PVAND_010398 [Polypedilum vanderplanki]|uniref:C2H2-type domain-containing protein n=1 Tax=Polypedilum vanderplanki TaxID=319348 RepID=A0A9J6CFJ4_POLVA|nr:hypothetical protein PVAND_010398 [Polypedilum vanderplanki]
MGHFKSELSIVTSYSEKPIYQLIEAFTEFVLSEEVITDCGICQNCLIKFNEYDELIMKAEAIQLDIVQLLENKVLAIDNTKINGTKTEIEDDDDPIEYEPLDEIYFQEETAEEITEEQFEEEIIDPTDLQFQMEVVVDDTKENLTEIVRHNQSVKTSSVIKNEEGYLIVELDNQRVYQCDICSKICKDKTKLKLHREIHTNLRNVICQQCGKGFKTMNCLRNHKRTHLPERVYFKCDQCDKKYTQKVQLKKHIEIVHMNRRDFKCETCNASFGTKSVLKMHMLSHSDYRSEECSICGFRVHTKAKLRRHMKSHTGVRDYNCGICGKKFLYSYNVIAHVRNVHEKKRSFNQLESIHEYEYEQKIE